MLWSLILINCKKISHSNQTFKIVLYSRQRNETLAPILVNSAAFSVIFSIETTKSTKDIEQLNQRANLKKYETSLKIYPHLFRQSRPFRQKETTEHLAVSSQDVSILNAYKLLPSQPGHEVSAQ